MNKLWYEKPAKCWKKALPIGNGITGVMVYGGKKVEKLAFNDCTLWSGYPKNQDNTESLANLDAVRKLVFEGKNKEADNLAERKMRGHYCESFIPIGMLKLAFSGKTSGQYSRELDISTAVHSSVAGGITRESFVSYPDKIAVYHISSTKIFNLTVSASSKLIHKTIVEGALNLVGNAPDYVAPNYLHTETRPIQYDRGQGMSFCLRVEALTDGKVMPFGKKLKIIGAKEITLYMATATGFLGYDKMPSNDAKFALDKCRKILANASKNYEVLKNTHITDYRSIYNKNLFSLNDENAMTTDKLLAIAKKDCAPKALIELFYNYGKYLTIAGSRKGGQPLNLQGLWNNEVRPPWSSNFTTNINTEMNYWGVSNSSLTECVEPYINLVYEIMQRGKKTAKVNYGCGGFACNHNVDIWRKTAPVQGNSSYMYAPMCGVWLANELYEHYKNGKLEEYKDKIFEIVKSACEFTLDYLVLHDGYYVTAPSASPENSFINDNGDKCALDYASAFELGLVRQVISNVLEIENDTVLAKNAKEKIAKLYPFTKGENGINEWHKSFVTKETGHRHFSPLYAFYPARAIKYYRDSEQTEWVRQLHKNRIDNFNWFVGWSAAWAICLSGRLHDSQMAKKVIDDMMKKSVFMNLFNVHPPFLFQIDGNFGFVGGINEMLVYTENDIIELLPALPNEWHGGEVKGYVVRGATIDFTWKNGEITKISSDKQIKVLNSKMSNVCKLGDNIALVDNIY